MTGASASTNDRGAPDALLTTLADYVLRKDIGSASAFTHARWCLLDAIGCALQALAVPDCVKLLGPLVPGTLVPHGARVPGTPHRLDPVKAAFDIGCLVRWLDFNDTWWAGGHPSDNCAGILAVADHLSRRRVAAGQPPLVMRDVLAAMIRAYEIHGVLAESNVPNDPEIGLDLVVLLKIASTAAIAWLMGGTREEIVAALSHSFIDGHSLNLYRHMPNSGPRKSWASADAVSRAVRLASIALTGEMGLPTALTAKQWGFDDVLYRGRGMVLDGPLGSRVIENVQYKINYPAQRHSQTAAECGVKLHPHVRDRLADIERVELRTHAFAMKKINATGPLPNFAARDHCLQYVVAIGMIFGDITTASYEDAFAADPRIDALRAKMVVREEPRYTAGYNDPAQRSDPNAVQAFFADGSATPRMEVHHLIGDARRRAEGLPRLEAKFHAAVRQHLSPKVQAQLLPFFQDGTRFEALPVHELMDLLAA